MADPLTTIYDAIWTHWESVQAFATLFPTRNRVKFDSPDPVKENVAEADLPEIRMIQATSEHNIPYTSNADRIVQTYTAQVATGSQKIPLGLMDVHWTLFTAMQGLHSAIKALDLSAFGTKVLTVAVGPMSAGVSDLDLNRGIKGWTIAWTITVEMTVARIA